MEKIAVTGATGFLGKRLIWYLQQQGYEVIPLTHTLLDISNPEACQLVLAQYQPQVLIHTAALSSTGYCEQHPEESYQVNVLGTVHLAETAKACGARFIYMSSDQVYSLPDVSWTHVFLEDEVSLSATPPKNVYGRHKLEMEERVQALYPTAIGLRLTWMYDQPFHPEFPGLPQELQVYHGITLAFEKARTEHTPIKACTQELRGITDVWKMVRNITLLVEREKSPSPVSGGIYNFGEENTLPTYKLYLTYARQWGVDESLIVPDSSWSRTLSMNTSKWKAQIVNY